MSTPKTLRVPQPMTPNVHLSNLQFGARKPIPRRLFVFEGCLPGTREPPSSLNNRSGDRNALVRHQGLFKNKYLKRREVLTNGIRYNRRFDLLMKFREGVEQQK